MEPYLILKYPKVRDLIRYQLSYTATDQFKGFGLFDFSRTWTYLEYLIPYATLPTLWILLYFSVVYVIIRARWQKRGTILLCILLVAQFIPMSKGYTASAVFIRVAISTFPFFAILTGIALANFLKKIQGHKSLYWAAIGGIVWVYAGTFSYTAAFVQGMAHEDPRVSIYRRLLPEAKLDSTHLLRVGLYQTGSWCEYFTVTPLLDLIQPPLKMEFVGDGTPLQAAQKFDYLIFNAFVPGSHTVMESKVAALVASGYFQAAEVFQTDLAFLGIHFNYTRNPMDLAYPFPTLYLLKSKLARH